MDRTVSILIAGAGPTGLAAAVELKRYGFSPRIVDRDDGPTPPDQSRALGILPPTLRVLEASGLTERLLAEGQRVQRLTIHLDGRALATMRTQWARETRYPFMLTLPQGSTERAMLDWLEGQGVSVEWNNPVTWLRSGPGGAEVELASGERIRADIVFGADGARSIVRRDAGIEWGGEDYPARFALADLRLSKPIDPTELHGLLRSEGGATALFPLRADLLRVVGFDVSTRDVIDKTPNVAKIVWESDFTVTFRHAGRMQAGRVFLAGDAAHVHSPVGARGMNLGIHDAATFAFLLSQGREGEYEGERLPVARRVVASTRRMTDFVRRRPAIASRALPIALPLAARTPFLRRRIVENVLGLDLTPSWLR
ncbi:FAD-dependent oxidoreductase [Aureimonas mangrovi]|uniref:FAD-dependent oxidoreductase n=1 Tax=Aureimonas mangrovi TaxID=2758041 RepID=UPI00163DB4A1|nr:FAD-dependent monooxygenase [Aureimonas mangrovi]